jgi:UDP-N-acetylmuramyl pentapeptide phosphotransferase/UDP-N-acetylglucosamine-1-phosphate transferase
MMGDLTSLFIQLLDLAATYRILLLSIACTGLGAAGAWLIAGTAFRERLLDIPNNRSSHTMPIPRGAGVGIMAAFIVAGLTLRIPTTFLFSVILISAVSLYGDYIRISVKFRLFIQAFSALIFLFPLLPRLSAHYALSTFGFFPPAVFILILLLIFLFIVGTANFYNFMDGINGIAGLSGMIGFGLLGVYTLYRPASDAFAFQTSFSRLSICIALACLGYLPFNMPRAKVFMGDVGSILLGFVFAGLVVTLSRNYLEMVCFTALLFPFYADELTTMAVRLRNHENLTQSHRRHLYQILVNELGIVHWKIAAAYGAAQAVVGAGILIAYPCGVKTILMIIAVCFVGFILLTTRIRQIANKHLNRGIS